ncbi:MAG TPA: lysozyme inhibitor LprI family protein, partial [Acetobacteraceae bacterium]|nr:lysozyme inhibitor LprI family protein [Acetobacteraceae bacterium]
MRALPLCAVLVLLGTAAAAQRAPDPARPTAQERAWLEACVNAAQGQPPRAAFGRCGWRLAAACQGYAGESLLDARMPAVPGRLPEPRGCAPVETALWQELLERWQHEAMVYARPAAAEPIRRAHRAFLAFRDASCAVEAAVARGTLAQGHVASCRLEATAL